MSQFPRIAEQPIERLSAAPDDAVTIDIDGQRCRAKFAIARSAERIANHYAALLADSAVAAAAAKLPAPFRHFGLILEFDRPAEIHLYDDERMLAPDVARLVERFGPVILRNAYLPEMFRAGGQRNIFPDLEFHYDRSPLQENRFSLFCRDPFDPVQRFPRASSTLILPNLAAYLQSVREGRAAQAGEQAKYAIFADTELGPLIGDILVELSWNAPEGTGEICVFDNRTVYHASYYRDGKGYPIGVRYLY